MICRKAIYFVPLCLAALLTPSALNHYAGETPAAIRADGTAPPPKPIPYQTDGGNFRADGTAPPPPPIPYLKPSSDVPVQSADGTAPPPKPIPWLNSSAGAVS